MSAANTTAEMPTHVAADAAMDKMFGAPEAISAPPPPPVEAPEPPEPTPPPAPKPPEKVDPPTPPPAPKPPEKAATLRQQYDLTKGELQTAQARIKELEAKASTPANEKELKELKDSVESIKSERDRLDQIVREKAFEQSDTFKKEFIGKMESAYADGVEEVKGFRVTDDAGVERFGTPEDFDRVMGITNNDDAWKAIEALFGTKASIIWQHRTKFIKAVQNKNAAVEENRKQGAEKERLAAQQQEAARTENAKTFQALIKQGVEQMKDVFAPSETDLEGNKVLDMGMAMADLAYGITSPESIAKLPEKIRARLVDGKLPPGEDLKLHSAIRNMAGAFPREKARRIALQAEVAELKAKVAAFEASEPAGGGEGAGRQNLKGKTDPNGTMASAEAALDRLVT